MANLPLHPGKAPAWLYKRMVRLGEAITGIIIEEYGIEKLFQLLSNPYWFQSFACVLGYDWHSSGTTTVTTAALREVMEKWGVMAAGGKGVAARTQSEIEEKAMKIDAPVERIKYASRMVAKVDNAALQDGYKLYHHMIFFDEHGRWLVIQQGMNTSNGYARRYHWIWKIKSFVDEPHAGIIGKKDIALNMVAHESSEARKASIDIVREKPLKIEKYIKSIRKNAPKQATLDRHIMELSMPRRINWDGLRQAYEIQPSNYEEMLAIKGIGPATVRALAYISELIYGSPPSWRDPVKFSFAVGGKDGVPYPVNRKAMDEATQILQMSLEEVKIGKNEKMKALKRLRKFVPE